MKQTLVEVSIMSNGKTVYLNKEQKKGLQEHLDSGWIVLRCDIIFECSLVLYILGKPDNS